MSTIFGLSLVVIAYLLPSVIARSRRHRNMNSICIVNLFFGWTLIGWVACLAWSASANVEGSPVEPMPTPSKPTTAV